MRRLRLAAGWVMFAYLTLHFLNHALGNISLEVMLWGSQIYEWIWRGPVGGPLLYAAFLTHFSLALWALYQRRSWRMGWGEGVRARARLRDRAAPCPPLHGQPLCPYSVYGYHRNPMQPFSPISR